MREVGHVSLPVSLRLDLSQGHAGELQSVLNENRRRRRHRDGVVQDLVKGPQAAAPLASGRVEAVLPREDHGVVDARRDRVLGEELPRVRHVVARGGLGDCNEVSNGSYLSKKGRFLRGQLHEALGGLQRGRDDEAVESLGGNNGRSGRGGGEGDLDSSSRGVCPRDADDARAVFNYNRALPRAGSGSDVPRDVLPQGLEALLKGEGAEPIAPFI